MAATAAGQSQAAPDPSRMPPPPASPVEHHDPDQQTCQPQALLQAWSLQLQAYADQPEAVLNRLRALQRDMATASLNRCIQRGLLSKADARQLAEQMGLSNGTASQSSSQRP
ncbi:MAG: hypothetical protein ACKOCA_11315 [Vulcanococcus sp.]